VGAPTSADAAKAEIAIAQVYLPAEMPQEELDALVRDALAETGVTDVKGMGQVMKVVMAKVAGRTDGQRAQEPSRRRSAHERDRRIPRSQRPCRSACPRARSRSAWARRSRCSRRTVVPPGSNTRDCGSPRRGRGVERLVPDRKPRARRRAQGRRLPGGLRTTGFPGASGALRRAGSRAGDCAPGSKLVLSFYGLTSPATVTFAFRSQDPNRIDRIVLSRRPE
jgi:hypothetical protein